MTNAATTVPLLANSRLEVYPPGHPLRVLLRDLGVFAVRFIRGAIRGRVVTNAATVLPLADSRPEARFP